MIKIIKEDKLSGLLENSSAKTGNCAVYKTTCMWIFYY